MPGGKSFLAQGSWKVMSSISVTCPQAIAAINHKARNREREKDPAVKALVRAWCKGKVCSCGCGKPANTAHHPEGKLYETDLIYLDLNNCEPFWYWCHRMMHAGFVRCPECGGWMRRGREKCSKCFGWKRNRKKPRKHPCLKNSGPQQCRQKCVCPYPPKKAEGCDHYTARVKV